MRTPFITLALAISLSACSGDVGSPGSQSEGSDTATQTDPETQEDAGSKEEHLDAEGSESGADEVEVDALEGDAALAPEPDADVTTEPGPEDVSSVDDASGSEGGEVDAAEPPHSDAGVPDEDDSASEPDSVSSPSDADSDSGPLLLCHILCDKVWNSCGSYAPYGQDQDSCVAACESMPSDSLEPLVTMSCVGDSCDEALCAAGGNGGMVQPLCVEACGLFEGCDLMAVIQPEYPDEPDLCLVECSGAMIIDPEVMPALVGSVVGTLSESCEADVMETCFEEVGPGGPGPGGQGPSCEEICDIATNFKCPPWEGTPEAWPTPADCLEDCEAFSQDPNATAYTMYGCAMSSTCGGLDKCTAPPAEDNAGCAALCQKAFQSCGDIGMPNPDFCTDYCTGQIMAFGGSVTAEEALACADLTPFNCNEDPYAQLLGCLLDLQDECTTICDATVDCPTENTLPVETCMPTCTAGYLNLFGTLSTSEAAACVAASSGDCLEVEACLAPPMPPTCYGMCDEGTMCDPALESCVGSCQAKKEVGKLADVACEYASQCAAPENCLDIEPASNPLCVDACMNAPPSVCIDQLEGCVAACTGLVVGSGITEPAFPACIATQLGQSCSVDNAYWSCQGP